MLVTLKDIKKLKFTTLLVKKNKNKNRGMKTSA